MSTPALVALAVIGVGIVAWSIWHSEKRHDAEVLQLQAALRRRTQQLETATEHCRALETNYALALKLITLQREAIRGYENAERHKRPMVAGSIFYRN